MGRVRVFLMVKPSWLAVLNMFPFIFHNMVDWRMFFGGAETTNETRCLYFVSRF